MRQVIIFWSDVPDFRHYILTQIGQLFLCLDTVEGLIVEDLIHNNVFTIIKFKQIFVIKYT